MNNTFTRIFYGGGKGKTSAALGYAYKSLKDGGTAYILQFDKEESEARLLERFEPEFKVFSFDKDMALSFSKKVISAGECDILVLDEVLGLLTLDPSVEDLIIDLIDRQKEGSVNLILTGPIITEKIAAKADYITELIKITK